MIAKKSDLKRLREEFKKLSRINTAPGMRLTRTTRGTFARPNAKNSGGGGAGNVPRWG